MLLTHLNRIGSRGETDRERHRRLTALGAAPRLRRLAVTEIHIAHAVQAALGFDEVLAFAAILLAPDAPAQRHAFHVNLIARRGRFLWQRAGITGKNSVFTVIIQ